MLLITFPVGETLGPYCACPTAVVNTLPVTELLSVPVTDKDPVADVNETPVTAAIVLGVPNDDIASCAIAVIPKPIKLL